MRWVNARCTNQPPREIRRLKLASAAAVIVTLFACSSTVSVREPIGKPTGEGKAEGRTADVFDHPSGAPLRYQPVPASRPTPQPTTRPGRTPAAEHDGQAGPPSYLSGRRQERVSSNLPRDTGYLVREKLEDRERYSYAPPQPTHRVPPHRLSTFSVDVDTGGYANVRRFLDSGRLPPREAVRVEELVNYFPYDYPDPEYGPHPLGMNTALAPSPWDPSRHLLRIAIQGRNIAGRELPAANLVFLVDVSGSMKGSEKLPLLKQALGLLAGKLRAIDSVALVTYANSSQVVLPPTPGDRHDVIVAALENLRAGGSTHGASGIRLAYRMAQQALNRSGTNRILLATDGDFNVGVTDLDALKAMVERKRRAGVSLSTLGFGAGNYNEALMETLADLGNGNYSYIDSLSEADKVLGRERAGTLFTLAKDVKVQVEFNPATVSHYRLIGFDNRTLDHHHFNDDRIDAGEVGAGHRVTALYELTLVPDGGPMVEPLRYGERGQWTTERGLSREIGQVKIRYKLPHGDKGRRFDRIVHREQMLPTFGQADDDFRFAVAVAGFGEWLREGRRSRRVSPTSIQALAKSARGIDRHGYRGEFLRLVAKAERLAHGQGHHFWEYERDD